MLNIVKNQDKFDYVLNYINEIKPFHTKIIDTNITYKIREKINVLVKPSNYTTIDLFFNQRNEMSQGYNVHPYGGILDDYPDEQKYSRNGYDIKKYDTNYFSNIDFETIPVEVLVLRGIDDYGFDESCYDDRKLFDEFDEVGIDYTPYDDANPTNYGLDEDGFDYTSFDDVYYDDFNYIEGFYDYGYKANSYGYNYDNNPFIDHIEQPSPTTIKVDIGEKLVIDASRVTPVGFDELQFENYLFDKIPNEIRVLMPASYELLKPKSLYDIDTFDSVAVIQSTNPGYKTFEIRNVCDAFNSLSYNDIISLSTDEIGKITNNQYNTLTNNQAIALLKNINFTEYSKIPITIYNKLTSNETSLLAEQLPNIVAVLDVNAIVILLNKLSKSQLLTVVDTIDRLSKPQIKNLSPNTFISITQNYTEYFVTKCLQFMLKVDESQYQLLSIDWLNNITGNELSLLTLNELEILYKISTVLEYTWDTVIISGLSTDKQLLLTTGSTTVKIKTPTINDIYVSINQTIKIYGLLNGAEKRDLTFLFNAEDYTQFITTDTEKWYISISNQPVGEYPIEISSGANKAIGKCYVYGAQPTGVPSFILANGINSTTKIRFHLIWARYDATIPDISGDLNLRYTYYTNGEPTTKFVNNNDVNVPSIPTRDLDTVGSDSNIYDDTHGLTKTNGSYAILTNYGNIHKYISNIDNEFTHGECCEFDYTVLFDKIEFNIFGSSNNILDYSDLKINIYQTSYDGKITTSTIDLKKKYTTNSIDYFQTNPCLTIQKTGSYWTIS